VSEREICGVCKGPWPCSCSPQAVMVVLRTEDDVSERLAAGMARQNDPLISKVYDPPIREVTWETRNGEFCGAQLPRRRPDGCWTGGRGTRCQTYLAGV